MAVRKYAIRSQLLGGHLLGIEATDVSSDVIKAIFYREVTRIEPMHLGVGQVLQVRLTTLSGEEDVILPPEDYRFGLATTQKLLPHGI